MNIGCNVYLRTQKNTYTCYIVVILIGFAVSLLLTSPVVTLAGTDQVIYRYIGMLINKGLVPYRDVFDHKPPVIYFIAALSFGSQWGYWFITSGIVVVAGIAFFKISQELGSKHAFLCTSVFFILMRWPPLSHGGGLTYEVTASATMFFILFCLFLKDNHLILLGAFFALIFFTQQNEMLGVIPFVIYAVFSYSKSKYKKLLLACGQLMIGGGIIVVPIFLFFIYHHAFSQFIYDAFLFNLKHYVGGGTWCGANVVNKVLNTCFVLLRTGLLPITLVVFLGNGYYFTKGVINKRHKTILLLTIIGMFLTSVSANLSGEYSGHYFLSYVIYLVVQIAIFTCYVNNNKLYCFLGWVLVAIMIGASVFLYGKHRKMYAMPRNGFNLSQNFLLSYTPLVSDVRGKDGQLFVYHEPQLIELNTYLNILAPTKWIYQWFLPTIDSKNYEFQKIIDDINCYKTKYILDFSAYEIFPNMQGKKIWLQMLRKHYVRVEVVRWQGKLGWLYVRN